MVSNTSSSPQSFRSALLMSMLMGLFFYYESFLMNMFNSIEPGLLQLFSVRAVGSFPASYFITNSLLLLPAGMMLDKFNIKNIIMLSMAISICGIVGFAFSQSVVMARISLIIAGGGAAFCFSGPLRYAAYKVPAKKLALVVGLMVMLGDVAGILAQTPLALLCQALGWRMTVLLYALTGPLLLMFINSFTTGVVVNQRSTNSWSHQLKDLLSDLKKVLTSRQNWLCGIFISLINLPVMLLGAVWGDLYLTQIQHISFFGSTEILMMIFVGMVVGSPVSGWLSDYMNKRKPVLLCGAIVSIVVILAVINFKLGFITICVLFFLLGLCSSTQIVAYPVVKESNLKSITGTALGFVALLIMGGGGILQYMFGWIASLMHNNYGYAIWMMPIGFIISFFCALGLKETFGQSPEEY